MTAERTSSCGDGEPTSPQAEVRCMSPAVTEHQMSPHGENQNAFHDETLNFQILGGPVKIFYVNLYCEWGW